MFSSVPCTLSLPIGARVYAHADDHHLFAGRAPLPTRWRRIAARKCEEVSFGDGSSVSRRSASLD